MSWCENRSINLKKPLWLLDSFAGLFLRSNLAKLFPKAVTILQPGMSRVNTQQGRDLHQSEKHHHKLPVMFSIKPGSLSELFVKYKIFCFSLLIVSL